ncbi:DUF6531 domain-containing protein [Streptomyces lichenis]|uniref:DUF6531 domain-containing protein n=2 Tax=Streptomyces lichenis TaxID=2306967 RepID=A0ABT0IH58_9ACTN|nr:RHS repeat-associated core domain-containing protein [Streptomyces lichenis]MCK8680669.1 DUF6531 domain-containing protein [Streptomyces lichenis]
MSPIRTPGSPGRPTAHRSGRLLAALLGALALCATAVPIAAAEPSPPPAPGGSHWGDHGRAAMPPVRAGSTTPPRSLPSAAPSAAERDWRQRALERLRTGRVRPAPRSGDGGDSRTAAYVPRGQGQVPWHRIADFRVTDALVARVDYSTGNLMLAATDVDLAGVGTRLQLTRTYNSFDAPVGQVSRPWWLGWERSLDLSGSAGPHAVVHHDQTGSTVEFTRQADGGYTTPAGYSLDLKKNADGTHTLTERGSGAADTYDAAGRLTKVSDRNGGTTTVTAHTTSAGGAAGFKLTETRSGRWIDLTHPTATRWEAKDHTGRTAVYELSADHGNLTRTTDTAGKSVGYAYDGDGRLTRLTTSEGRSTAFTYDAADRVTSVRRYAESGGGTGPTHRYAYSAAGALEAGTTTVTDPLGHATRYEHNADGEVTKAIDPLNHVRAATYLNRLLQTATDAMGTGNGGPGANVTTYGWDARNNPTSAKLPTGATASGSWQTVAGAERPTSTTSADGQKTEFAYDAAGNTLSVSTPGSGGGTRTFAYNEASPRCGGFQGQTCTATDGNGKKTEFRYDAQGNLESATPPAPLGRTTYTYDSLGRTATVTDGRGVKATYSYDKRDRVVKVDTSGGGAAVIYAYDGDGNLTTRTDTTGTQRYQFDALSRETVRTLQDGSQTILAYTADGNVETYKDPGGTTAYAWDAADRLLKLTDPRGKHTTYSYDDNDRRTATTYPGGTVQQQTLDASGRPTAIKAIAPSGVILSHLAYEYGYVSGQQSLDGVKIRARSDRLAKSRTTFGYNDAGRLALAAETGQDGVRTTWQFCYDAAGNRTSEGSSPGCPAKGAAYSYNDASQLTARNGVTTGWSYDKAGNETAAAPAADLPRTAEQYTDHNQLKDLTSAGTRYTAQYASTDSSERTRLGSTAFHHGPLGLSGQTTGGKDTEFIREPRGTLASVTTGGRGYYYLTDALGSVIAVVDESGNKVNSYAYTPTGLPRAGTAEQVPQPYRFAGGYRDPSGLYHLGARYYDPQLGRFTQLDPAGKETNPYLYADGDPMNRIDPHGTFSGNIGVEVCFVLCVGGGATGDSSGNESGYLTFGLGSPGASVDVGLSSGDVQSGWSGEVSCGLGPVSGTVSTEGDVGVESGGTTGKCSGSAQYTF